MRSVSSSRDGLAKLQGFNLPTRFSAAFQNLVIFAHFWLFLVLVGSMAKLFKSYSDHWRSAEELHRMAALLNFIFKARRKNSH